jgi:hypothetical protein
MVQAAPPRCLGCGHTAIQAEAKFCSRCGGPLTAVANSKPKKPKGAAATGRAHTIPEAVSMCRARCSRSKQPFIIKFEQRDRGTWFARSSWIVSEKRIESPFSIAARFKGISESTRNIQGAPTAKILSGGSVSAASSDSDAWSAVVLRTSALGAGNPPTQDGETAPIARFKFEELRIDALSSSVGSMLATCLNCQAIAPSESARYCTKCGEKLKRVPSRTLRKLFAIFNVLRVIFSAIRAIRPRRSARYTWRSRGDIIRASQTAGRSRGRPRPEVFKVPELSRSAKRVYFYLSRVSEAGGNAIPFVRTIAVRTGLSKSSVNHALAELERRGLLTRTHRYSRRGGSSNVYHCDRLIEGPDNKQRLWQPTWEWAVV